VLLLLLVAPLFWRKGILLWGQKFPLLMKVVKGRKRGDGGPLKKMLQKQVLLLGFFVMRAWLCNGALVVVDSFCFCGLVRHGRGEERQTENKRVTGFIIQIFIDKSRV
jgi:hypothetical protein